MSFTTSSSDINRSAKILLTELLGYPDGAQVRNLKFMNSSNENRFRVVSFLDHEGYLSFVEIDGYQGYLITMRGRNFLRWAIIHC